LRLGGVNIHANEDRCFRQACGNGHLVIARWLFNLGGVNTHAVNDDAFRWACGKGYLVVAQWLFSLGDVDIHARNDAAFQWACASGHLGLGRWLCALDPEWDWPADGLRSLQTWTPARDAWMRTVLSRC
jgi:hypothetical protein